MHHTQSQKELRLLDRTVSVLQSSRVECPMIRPAPAPPGGMCTTQEELRLLDRAVSVLQSSRVECLNGGVATDSDRSKNLARLQRWWLYKCIGLFPPPDVHLTLEQEDGTCTEYLCSNTCHDVASGLHRVEHMCWCGVIGPNGAQIFKSKASVIGRGRVFRA